MTDRGKIDADFFDRVVRPNLGADRSDVRLGPTPGVDFGLVAVGDRTLVVSTDPISLLPALGLERAGRLAIDIVLSDVAVSGVPPSHLTVSLALPTAFEDETVAGLWRGIAGYARDVGVAIAAGHTGRYPGVAGSWVGAGTAIGVGDAGDVVRPDGARPGDVLVVATGPAAEVAGLFAVRYPEALGLDPETIAIAQDRVDDIAAVADALAAHRAGEVTAMHDATEGGIAAGLAEMADGAGVRFELDRASVPVRDGVAAVCGAIDVDPWHVSSAGTLLIAVDPADADAVVSALERRDTPAAAVGRVESGTGVYADGERIRPPDRDPSWAAAERLDADAD
jgi:hydrogenase expression/formation protein HypE